MSTEHWKRDFSAILLGEFLAIVGFSLSLPVIPFFLEQLGITDSLSLKLWSGLTISASSLALALFAPMWGALSDQYGRKIMLLRAMTAGGILVGILALAQSPLQVLVIRTLQGAFTGTVTAAIVLTITLVPTNRVALCLGLLQTSIYTGNTVGPAIGGFLFDFVGAVPSFIISGGMLLLGAIIIFFFVHESFEKKPSDGASLLKRAIPDFSILKNDAGLATLLILVCIVQMAFSLVQPILVLFIREITVVKTTAGSYSGLIMGLSALASAVASAFFGLATNKINQKKLLVFCILGVAFTTLPQAFVSNVYQLLFLRIVSGFFSGGVLTGFQAFIALEAPKGKQGAVYGLNSCLSSLGMALGPALGSFTAAAIDYRAVFTLNAFIIFVIGIVVLKKKKL